MEKNNHPQGIHPSSRNEFSAYYNKPQHNHHGDNKHRTRSETRLLDDCPPATRYSSRLVNSNGTPISHNPLWTGQSPAMAGSQPNLLSPEYPLHRQKSPSNIDRRLPSAPMYSSHIIERPIATRSQAAPNPGKRSGQGNRKQTAQSQYLDTNEFILRASHDQPLRNDPYAGRYGSALIHENRPHSININDNHAPMLDVYY